MNIGQISNNNYGNGVQVPNMPNMQTNFQGMP